MFNYKKFWDNINDIEVKKKVSKKGKLNCASNELVHPELIAINNKMMELLDINVINSYVYYPDEIDRFSTILKIPSKYLQLYAGSDDAIKVLLTALHINCKNIIIQSPNYENYFCYGKLNGYNIKRWEMDKTYKFDIITGRKIINSMGTSVIILTIPNGFTGFTMPLNNIEIIIKEAYHNNSIVIIDQAYAPFARRDYTNYALKYNNVIVISTLSKGIGLSGARLAYTCACESITSYLAKWNGINSISALTYRIGEYYLSCKNITNIVDEIINERISFINFINYQTFWQAYDSKANFVLVSLETKERAIDLTEYFNKNNIIIRKLSVYPFENCIRFTIVDACNMKKIKNLIMEYLEKITDNTSDFMMK